MKTNITYGDKEMTDRICPKCNGTGHVGYRKDFGICYRCNGFGTLNSNGSKKLTATQKKEVEEQAAANALISKHINTPAFASLKKEMMAKYGDCLDGFLYYGDYEIASMLEGKGSAEYSSTNFTYNKETKTFVTEASSIQYNGEKTIRIRSINTGNVKTFTFENEEKDAEGDTTSWNFKCENMKVIIFND